MNIAQSTASWPEVIARVWNDWHPELRRNKESLVRFMDYAAADSKADFRLYADVMDAEESDVLRLEARSCRLAA